MENWIIADERPTHSMLWTLSQLIVLGVLSWVWGSLIILGGLLIFLRLVQHL
jgi:hypothetical protein